MEFLCGDVDALSLNKSGPEYPFWALFFDLVDDQWSREFKERAAASDYIWWDFVDGVDPSLPKGEQYQQVLAIATNMILETLARSNLMLLRDHAERVLDTRKRVHARYPEAPQDPRWAIHKRIIELWIVLVEAIVSRTS